MSRSRRTRTTRAAVTFGTPKNVYSMYGWAIGPGQTVPPDLQAAPAPGMTGWTMPSTPASMSQGPSEAAVTNDGTHNIILVASYNAGLGRYVEP